MCPLGNGLLRALRAICQVLPLRGREAQLVFEHARVVVFLGPGRGPCLLNLMLMVLAALTQLMFMMLPCGVEVCGAGPGPCKTSWW